MSSQSLGSSAERPTSRAVQGSLNTPHHLRRPLQPIGWTIPASERSQKARPPRLEGRGSARATVSSPGGRIVPDDPWRTQNYKGILPANARIACATCRARKVSRETIMNRSNCRLRLCEECFDLKASRPSRYALFWRNLTRFLADY